MHRNQPVLIGFCAFLALAWFCYQPAISGTFQFDDEFNLGGLAEVQDAQSAIDFIISGVSGPTGRPLALASFALQAASWEQGAAAFLRVNILVHLLNAILLALCVYQLSRQTSMRRDDAAIVAAATACLWVLMPLLATASLIVVQRMTTLSALFMLLGLNAYLIARSKANAKPRGALRGMTASLAAGTVLATLCKESGALLPVLVLVLEATILQRPAGINVRHWRTWQAAVLVLPLVLILLYLAGRSIYPDALVLSRGFNAWERLITEAGILWVYLLKAIVGIPSQLGIYQDPPAISRSLFSLTTFLACIAWVGLLLASIVWRRRYPLFALAVLWYLAGHMIESTIVPLELYFEHRNYIPLIGPLIALVSFILMQSTRRHRLRLALILGVAIANSWFLYSFASLSGDPSLASRYWAQTYPGSQRAAARLARFQLDEEGPLPALQTIDAFVSTHPEHGYMLLPALNLLCKYAPEHDHRPVAEQLEATLPTVEFSYSVAQMMFELLGTTSSSGCKGVDPGTIVSLATTLRANPRYTNEPLYNQFYRKTLAIIAQQQGDHDAAIDHLHQAMTYGHSSELNLMMVTALAAAGDLAGARAFIDEAETRGPANPLKAVKWRRVLKSLQEYIRNQEKGPGLRQGNEIISGTETGRL